jgi:shikimate dehydrogenase
MIPWAEVIGDPVGHSLSPAIHRHWLAACGIAGDYRAKEVTAPRLDSFLPARRALPEWRGCNVTAPHKLAAMPLVDIRDAAAEAVGALNCVYRDGARLIGTNTDVDGVAEALAGLRIAGGKAAVIGAGGGARAAIHWLRRQGAGEIVLVARRPSAAEALGPGLRACALAEAAQAFASASLIVNATPLGLEGGEAMPAPLLNAVQQAGAAAAFDMVYRPLQTPFLRAAAAGGARTIDGLAMLIGQARRSFALFFGAAPPAGADAALRRLVAP